MKSRRTDQLQFLRFLAFLLICVYHTGRFQPAWWPGDNAAANAVEFFIVLSGVVAACSSYHKEIHFSIAETLKYVWKKIKQVYPLYFVTVMVTVSYSKIPSLVEKHAFADLKALMIQLVKQLLLIQSWFKEGYFEYNGVAWFLSTMLFLYLFSVPLRTIATKIKKMRMATVLFAVIFVISAALTILYCYMTRNTFTEFTQYIFPPSRVGEYICGMSLGYLACSLREKLGDHFLWTVIFTVLEIGVLVLNIRVMYIPAEYWTFRVVQWLLPNCLLLFVFIYGRGLLSAIFRIPFLRYLGDITFECFLIHQVVINMYRKLCGIEDANLMASYFTIIFCVGVTVMMAMLVSEKKVFQPSAKHGRKAVKKKV